MGNCLRREASVDVSGSDTLIPLPVPRLQLRSSEIRDGGPVKRRMVWVEDERFSGWCCADCRWAVTAPSLYTTVAVLAFNRSARENFDKHDCVAATNDHHARVQVAGTTN